MTSQKREREDALPSETHRIDTGYGKLYVIVTFDEDGDPFEVFAHMGMSGGNRNTWCEAVGKLMSTALRAGVDAAEVADAVTGIKQDKVKEDNGDTVESIPEAIGIGLLRAAGGEE